MNLQDHTAEELALGYSHRADAWTCLHCGQVFEEGEIFPLNDRLYEAGRAVQLHLQLQHPDYLQELIHLDSKYNPLTQNQMELLALFAAGLPDREVAKRLGVSASTVRHQRFTFREKAKAASLYLAIYHRVFEMSPAEREEFVPVHAGARQVDERYVVTLPEQEHILQTAFESLSPLRLRAFSPKEKKKVVILTRVAQEFTPGRDYSEAEVNEVLRNIFDDFATLRRYLIQYGFLQRTKDGARYWRT